MTDWITTDWMSVAGVAMTCALGVIILIGLNRLFGLRSFSKLSGFDFAITVAFGSILATMVVAKDPPLLQGAAALLFLFAVQGLIGYLRLKSDKFENFIGNAPRLVFKDGEFIEDQMAKAKITRDDIIAKMREANAIRIEDIKAVVVETTGDISVLHVTGNEKEVDDLLTENVLGWNRD